MQGPPATGDDHGRQVRAFVAVPLPQALQGPVGKVCAELAATLPRVRWAQPRTLHLTLRFFAAVAEDSLEKIAAIMVSVGRSTPPFQLRLRGLGAFPTPHRPRVVWLGINDAAPLFALQQRLSDELARAGFPGDDRPFAPHLTLGRLRGKGTDPMPARHAAADCGLWPVTELVLYESRPSPGGVLHIPRETVVLPNP